LLPPYVIHARVMHMPRRRRLRSRPWAARRSRCY